MPKILSVNEDTSQAKLACDHADLCNLGIIEKQAEGVEESIQSLLPMLQIFLAGPLAEAGFSMQGPGGSSNLYDRVQDQTAGNAYLRAMTDSAQLDAPTYIAMARALLESADRSVAPGSISDEAVQAMASKIANMSPILSMIFPQMWDRVHGRSGSSATLTSALMRNSRWSGMTPERASDISTGIMTAYRSDPAQFRGLGTYELGDLFQEMSAAGMMPTDPTEAIAALREMSAPVAAARDAGLPGGLAALAAIAPDGVGINSIDPAELAHRIRTNANISRMGGYGPKNIPTAWGAGGRAQWNKADVGARQRAAMSPAANRLGASLRLGSMLGFKVENPEQVASMTDREWSRWAQTMSGGRISLREARSALRAQSSNQEAGFLGNAKNTVRNLQGQEVAREINRYFGRRGPQDVGGFIMGLSPQIAANGDLRRKALQQRYGISPIQAETLWTEADHALRRRDNKGLGHFHRLHNTNQVGYMQDVQQYAEDEARSQSNASGSWDTDWIRRGAQSLMDGEDLSTVLSGMVGFIPTDTIEGIDPDLLDSEGRPNPPKPLPEAPKYEPQAPPEPFKSSSDKVLSGIIKLALNKVGLKLGPSKIDGTGLFAGDNFKEGEFIAQGATLKDVEKNAYDISVAARYTNHSLDPNTELLKEGGHFKIYAMDNIKVGEELTANYYQVNAVMGPEAKMDWHGEEMPAKDFTKFSGDGTERRKSSAREEPVKKKLNRDVYVQSAIPSSALAMVRKHGLLSSEALLSNSKALKAMLASRKGTGFEEDEAEFTKRVQDKLKDEFWGDSMRGPSVFFGDPDPDKITDVHPTRQIGTNNVLINLSKLLQDQPKTRIAGTELKPYDPEGPEAQGDLRHYDIDLDKVREYAATDPKELWKHYNSPEGTHYASNVPHGQIITPSGSIDPKYMDIVNLIKKSRLNKLAANAAILSEKQAADPPPEWNLSVAEKGALLKKNHPDWGDDIIGWLANHNSLDREFFYNTVATPEWDWDPYRFFDEAPGAPGHLTGENVVHYDPKTWAPTAAPAWQPPSPDDPFLQKLKEVDPKSWAEVMSPPKKVRLLNKLAANAAVLADLKKAKKESDKGNYAAKTDILRKLLKAFPDEFKTDSENAHVVGLTHKPTNFRIHMPKKALPTKIKEEKQSTGAPKKALPTKAKDKKKMHT